MQYDKNGCGCGWMDCWCWKCSTYDYNVMAKNQGKGKMTYRKMVKKEDYAIYKCENCNYQYEYEMEYVTKYAIR